MAGAIRMRIQWKRTPEEIRRAFTALASGLEDWSPTMVRIRSVLSEMFEGVFTSAGADLGKQWTELDPETVRRKMRNGGAASRATLRAQGALEASLTSDTADGAIRRVVVPKRGASRLQWGTRLPYAAALQFGAAKHGLPARRFVGLTDNAKEELVEILEDALSKRLEETARGLSGGA